MDSPPGKSSRTHGDCEWEIAERAQDAVESKFCDLPQAIFMFGNSLLIAAPVNLSLQHIHINMRERKLAGAAMRMFVSAHGTRSTNGAKVASQSAKTNLFFFAAE